MDDLLIWKKRVLWEEKRREYWRGSLAEAERCCLQDVCDTYFGEMMCDG